MFVENCICDVSEHEVDGCMEADGRWSGYKQKAGGPNNQQKLVVVNIVGNVVLLHSVGNVVLSKIRK